MNVTLKEIADRAGVSVATVSMALNKKKGVSEGKADELRRIAAEMGYVNRRSRGVKGKSINFIQILEEGSHRSAEYRVFLADHLRGVSDEVARHGLNVEISTIPADPIEDVYRAVEQSNAIGTVILSSGLTEAEVRMLVETSSPMVFLEASYPGVQMDAVDLNNEDCVAMALDYLRAHGHEKIGFVQAKEHHINFERRERAFQVHSDKPARTAGADWRYTISIDRDRGMKEMISVLERVKRLPTALFCVSDLVAYNVIRACAECRIDVPGDIAVVGFDDLPASEHVTPPLTTIRISRILMAQRAVQILIAGVDGHEQKSPEKTLIGGRLVVRESA